MLAIVGGDIVALIVILIMLIDATKFRHVVETAQDRLFCSVSSVAILTIILGSAMTLFPAFAHSLYVRNGYAIGVLSTLTLALIWIAEHVLGSSPSITRLSKAMIALLCIGSLFLIVDAFVGSLLSINHKRILFALISLLFLLPAIVTVWRGGREKTAAIRHALLGIPVIFLVGVITFLATGLTLSISVSFVTATLFSYLLIQNYRYSMDQLTGTLNRRSFMNSVSRLFHNSYHGSILVLDIAEFSYFNQNFGQHRGDRLLIAISRYLVTIAPDRKVYRYNGDQFALIFSSTNRHEIQKVITKIQTRFTSSWKIDDIKTTISVRMAVTPFPARLMDVEALIYAMDLTLAHVKQGESNQVTEYSASIRTEHERRQKVKEAITRAIEGNSLRVLYQPIYETHSLHIYSAEALARIDDPYIGHISPAEFIPIAEETGLIVELTYAVLRQVCVLWLRLGDRAEHLKRIAVNLSAVNFLEPEMEHRILDTVRHYGVEPKRVKFELTETTIIRSFDRVKRVMDICTTEGMSFSLDDYGKGYSNLEYLVNLPFSTVKIDKSIVQACQKNDTLLESIVLMLTRMEKKVVAEGIETEQQLDMLTRAGATRLQGFLFSRPISAEELEQLIL